ncbi:uncharacterized protein LOC135169896 [Diachasmimorpha longicaudata]|uniref:uncharacterized protein LOC135169896 n=1 Tax=Diachasmimorpha longicaudata TaxID=58733 RepID=UPI0030B8B34A
MNILSGAVTSFFLIIIYPLIFASPIVKIQNGKLQGSYMQTRKGREFSAFRGIPYALPPIGELRFEPAHPMSSWTGTRLADNDGSVCVQNDVLTHAQEYFGSENCLYLNVYTPKVSYFESDQEVHKYPVMVWIHGGGWVTWSSDSSLFGPQFLLDKEVVLVSFNYRLGPLGFLSTADKVLPGNQGLKDQVLALKWVQNNIGAFGGDPNRVTIFGESAGGASTHYLMLSPLAKGLFHRVISQSGTALAPWSRTTPHAAKKQAQRLAKQLNCPIAPSEKLRDCLQHKDPIELASAVDEWPIFTQDPMIPFKPVVEPNYPGAFLTEDPVKILDNGNLTDIPWMTGFTSHEGAIRVAFLYGQDDKYHSIEKLSKNYMELAPLTLMYEDVCPKNIRPKVTAKIREFYLGDREIDESTRMNVLHMYSDAMFTFNTAKSVEKHLKSLGSPIYYYYLAYRGTNSWSKLFGDEKRDYGVSHCDDLQYLFPQGDIFSPGAQLTEDDGKMVDIITSLWYNFAKTGNPTPEITPELPVKWKPVRTKAGEYLSIGGPRNIKMSENLLKERLKLWKGLPCGAGLAPLMASDRVKDELYLFHHLFFSYHIQIYKTPSIIWFNDTRGPNNLSPLSSRVPASADNQQKMLALKIIAVLSFWGIFVSSSPIVKIKNGTLEGSLMKTRYGREFPAFRGIPYALPPLGNLRFEPPKPAAAWKGVRSAMEDAAICTQRNIYTHQEEIVGTEDCLYLNVYTPKLPDSNAEEQTTYPIMIWIHGGGWVTGAGHSEFYGPKFLLDHDIVLVTLNFRLGPLGFLSTEDLVVPGNQGMKDQSQAIRWVRENIAAFGGDPNRVTVFGESAGGASTHYHMMSPLSRDHFHRGISHSGTALCPWVLTRPGIAKRQAKRLGELLNCPTDSSAELLSCLKKKDHEEIIATDREFQIFDYDPMIPFRPVIEPDHAGAFLIEEPARTLKTGNMADIPWMTGFNSHEGAIKVAGLYGIKDKKYVKMFNERFMELAPMSLGYEDTCPKEFQDDVSRKIRQFYLGNKPADESNRFKVIDMYSDAWFNVGADMAVKDHLEVLSSPVYYYYFAYRGSASFSRLFGDEIKDYGVSHADELQYFFPVGEQLFPDIPFSKEDHRVTDIMTKLWTNFAKTGNPTPTITPELSLKWKPVRTEDLEYLLITNSKNVEMSKGLLKDRIELWASLPHRANVDTTNKSSLRKDEL